MAPAIFVSRGAKFWGRGRSLERLGRLSIGFHIPLVHSVRNEFKTLCGRAEKPHPAASEQPPTFFFFFATQFFPYFFFFISSYFQKIDKNIKTSPGDPVLGPVASRDGPLSFPTIAKIPPGGVPEPCAPEPAWGGKARETQRGRGGVGRARAAWILLAAASEKITSKIYQKSEPGRKSTNRT